MTYSSDVKYDVTLNNDHPVAIRLPADHVQPHEVTAATEMLQKHGYVVKGEEWAASAAIIASCLTK